MYKCVGVRESPSLAMTRMHRQMKKLFDDEDDEDDDEASLTVRLAKGGSEGEQRMMKRPLLTVRLPEGE